MVVLGTDPTGKNVVLSDRAHESGLYVLGTTGTGKTTVLKQIVYQKMLAGEGLCVIDPHGDLIDDLLGLVPERRLDDVLLFAPGDSDQTLTPLGLNILDCDRNDPRQRRRVTATVIDTLRKLFSYSWGPRMEDLLRNSLYTLMEWPESTLLDLWLLLASPKHREKYTKHLRDTYLQQFWGVQFAGYAQNSRDLVDLVGSSLNKIGRFLADPAMRRIVGQPRNAFDLREIMDTRKILLVNLSKGDLGEDNSALLGSVLVNLILIAALTRRDTPPEKRVPFHLIVDEYQNFATSDTFSTLQSEARKYKITTTVAHQYRDQLDDLNKGSTLNVANFIVLRLTGIDSQEIATQFDNTPPEPVKIVQRKYIPSQKHPQFVDPTNVFVEVKDKPRSYSDVLSERANTLSGLPTLAAKCRLLVGGKLVEYDLTIHPLPIAGQENTASYIRERSLDRGQDADAVDQWITDQVGEDIDFDELQPNDLDADDEEM